MNNTKTKKMALQYTYRCFQTLPMMNTYRCRLFMNHRCNSLVAIHHGLHSMMPQHVGRHTFKCRHMSTTSERNTDKPVEGKEKKKSLADVLKTFSHGVGVLKKSQMHKTQPNLSDKDKTRKTYTFLSSPDELKIIKEKIENLSNLNSIVEVLKDHMTDLGFVETFLLQMSLQTDYGYSSLLNDWVMQWANENTNKLVHISSMDIEQILSTFLESRFHSAECINVLTSLYLTDDNFKHKSLFSIVLMVRYCATYNVYSARMYDLACIKFMECEDEEVKVKLLHPLLTGLGWFDHTPFEDSSQERRKFFIEVEDLLMSHFYMLDVEQLLKIIISLTNMDRVPVNLAHLFTPFYCQHVTKCEDQGTIVGVNWKIIKQSFEMKGHPLSLTLKEGDRLYNLVSESIRKQQMAGGALMKCLALLAGSQNEVELLTLPSLTDVYYSLQLGPPENRENSPSSTEINQPGSYKLAVVVLKQNPSGRMLGHEKVNLRILKWSGYTVVTLSENEVKGMSEMDETDLQEVLQQRIFEQMGHVETEPLPYSTDHTVNTVC